MLARLLSLALGSPSFAWFLFHLIFIDQFFSHTFFSSDLFLYILWLFLASSDSPLTLLIMPLRSTCKFVRHPQRQVIRLFKRLSNAYVPCSLCTCPPNTLLTCQTPNLEHVIVTLHLHPTPYTCLNHLVLPGHLGLRYTFQRPHHTWPRYRYPVPV